MEPHILFTGLRHIRKCCFSEVNKMFLVFIWAFAESPLYLRPVGSRGDNMSNKTDETSDRGTIKQDMVLQSIRPLPIRGTACVEAFTPDCMADFRT